MWSAVRGLPLRNMRARAYSSQGSKILWASGGKVRSGCGTELLGGLFGYEGDVQPLLFSGLSSSRKVKMQEVSSGATWGLAYPCHCEVHVRVGVEVPCISYEYGVLRKYCLARLPYSVTSNVALVHRIPTSAGNNNHARVTATTQSRDFGNHCIVPGDPNYLTHLELYSSREANAPCRKRPEPFPRYSSLAY